MRNRATRLRVLFAVAGAFIVLHWLSMLLAPSDSAVYSYPFVIAAPLLAFVGCSLQFRSGTLNSRISWILVGASLLLWSSGMTIEAWDELVRHVSPEIASFSDFNLFIFGVPTLLAISRPTKRDNLPLFVWLDGIQAVVTAYLIYLTFFSVSPFTRMPIQPIGVKALILVYTIESLVLAGGASLRYLTHRRDEAASRFYKVLSTYLWMYVVCIGLLNYAYLTRAGKTGYFDLTTDFCFLYLAIAAALYEPVQTEVQSTFERKTFVLFFDNISPSFFTAAMFILCFVVLRSHYYSGIVSMVMAFAVYSVRMTALQSRFIKTQQELLEMRDQLQEMSLTDALTGVANRRSFDISLEDEWGRAVRAEQSLALLMLDADYFKMMNDKHGHTYGDGCLQKIAHAMRDALPRGGDMLARYGGEEFVVLLPATGIQGAEAVAAKMQAAVNSLEIEIETPTGRFATVSVGFSVVEFPTHKKLTDLLESADLALYRAKQNGRNRIEYQAT